MVDDKGIIRPTSNAQLDSCQKSDDTIHVLLSVYDPHGTYSQHAGVVMTSIFENTKSKVTVHIFHDNTLTEDNRKKFIRTAEKYSQILELHDVTEYALQASRIPTFNLTIGTLYRLFAPRILKIRKIIYLDADIVVNLDIKEFWKIETGDKCIGGFHSPMYENIPNYVLQKLNGGDCHYNINAGCIIMNLDNIRAKGDLFDDAVEWFSRRSHLATTVDNDFINAYFTGSMSFFEERFHVRNPPENKNLEDCIIHTPGRLSSLCGMSGLKIQRLYWHYFLRSAWGENLTPAEVCDTLCNAAERLRAFNEKFFHPTAGMCVKRLLVAIPRRIFWSNNIMLSLRYIVKDIYYRLKNKIKNHR